MISRLSIVTLYRDAGLVSASIAEKSQRLAEWTLNQVQGDTRDDD